MSRVEENKEWVERQPKTFTGNYEDINAKIEMCIYSTLLDISKSLAVIADNVSKDPIRSCVDVNAAATKIQKTCETCKHWAYYPAYDNKDINPCEDCNDYDKWRPENG